MWVTKALQQDAAFLAFVPKSRHSCVAKSATAGPSYGPERPPYAFLTSPLILTHLLCLYAPMEDPRLYVQNDRMQLFGGKLDGADQAF